jgi:hypothetical protein
MTQVKATFLLPIRDNDGRDLASEIQNVQEKLWLRFSAYTTDGRVTGVYQMVDGSKSTDFSEKFSVIIEEASISALEEVLKEFKKGTIQESIYLEILHHVEFRLI